MVYNASDWVTGTQIQVPLKAPSFGIQACFFNSYTNTGPIRNVWETVRIAQELPATAKAIHVTGLLIISHGSTAETADLTIYFRRNNSFDPTGNYKAQCIEATIGAGQRSTMSCWIPLDNGSFQWKWNVINLSTWPTYSSYGLNLVVDAVLT